MIFGYAAMSQVTLYQDDFESYTVGGYIAAQNPDWWDTWSGAPGTGEDGLISDDFANSPTKSVLVDETGGATDLIFKMGNKTSGVYNVDFYVYIPSGNAGYYNFQHFESPGIEWAFELYMNTDGTTTLHADVSSAATWNYAHDTWIPIHHMVDLDNDWIQLWFDGVMVYEWQFSTQSGGGAGTKQLGSIDFFAGAQGSDVPLFYFDDIVYEVMPSILYEDDFESYPTNSFIAVENPDWFTTWSNAPGSGEDGIVSDDQGHTPIQSVLVDETNGATDLILKLGDKVSGSYELSWEMYVPTGYAGYYNIQHFESPGIEWAFELYFNTDGTALLHADVSSAATFNYDHDTWFPVYHIIDLDNDWIELWVDDVLIYEWQFSTQSGGGAGTNQLGGVDFFAGAQGSDIPLYYFDDVMYVQASANTDPIISVSPSLLQQTAPAGTITEKMLTIENIGSSDLEYEVLAIYNVASMKHAAGSSLNGNAHSMKSLGYTGTSADPNAKPAAYNPPPTDDAVLNYDGENSSAIGWNSPPITPTVAAMFPAAMTNQYAGMSISSVDVYINDMGTDFSLKIYDMGNVYEPGQLLYEQDFTPMGASWNNIMLDNPVTITGADIWVGYQFTQTATETFIPGCDAGPNHPLGDFISTGVGWSHLSNNPDLPYNWNIRANLTGDPIDLWLSFDPATGTVAPGGSQDVTVYFNSMGMAPGAYQAIARVVSNDPENPQIDVPVAFVVTPGGTMQSVILDFEDIDDWSLTFDDWTAVDVDGGDTWGIDGVSFPHMGEPMAFICFNPDLTDPPMTDDPEIQPHAGERFGACFASIPPPFNNDWLISPQITLGTNSSFNFWIRSYTDAYGLDKYNVGISTTGMDPEDFMLLNDPSPLGAPTEWTEMNFDISDYDGQTVYVAIQCVSEDSFILMVDDISVDFMVGQPEIAEETSFSMYPNPAKGFVRITSSEEMSEVEILNQLGQKVYHQSVGNTTLNLSTLEFESGVYYVRITSQNGSSIEKLVIQ